MCKFADYVPAYFNSVTNFHYSTWQKTYYGMPGVDPDFVSATQLSHIKKVWKNQEDLNKNKSFAPAIIAQENNQIVAIIRGNEHAFSGTKILKYEQVYVRPENQRQGLGAALSYLLFFKALQEGIQSAVVEIDRGNNGSLQFQKHIGAQEQPVESVALDWRGNQKFENPIWVVTHPNLSYSMSCLQEQLQTRRANLWSEINKYVREQK